MTTQEWWRLPPLSYMSMWGSREGDLLWWRCEMLVRAYSMGVLVIVTPCVRQTRAGSQRSCIGAHYQTWLGTCMMSWWRVVRVMEFSPCDQRIIHGRSGWACQGSQWFSTWKESYPLESDWTSRVGGDLRLFRVWESHPIIPLKSWRRLQSRRLYLPIKNPNIQREKVGPFNKSCGFGSRPALII
jgi:hypothetical protein